PRGGRRGRRDPVPRGLRASAVGTPLPPRRGDLASTESGSSAARAPLGTGLARRNARRPGLRHGGRGRAAGERAHLRSPPAHGGRDRRDTRARKLHLPPAPPRGADVYPRRLQSRPPVGLGRRSDGARLRVVRDRRPRPRCREVPRGPALVVFPLRPRIRERAGGVPRVVRCGGERSETAAGPRLRGVVPRRVRGPPGAAVPPRLGGAHRRSGATRRGAARPATLSSPASRGASVRCASTKGSAGPSTGRPWAERCGGWPVLPPPIARA